MKHFLASQHYDKDSFFKNDNLYLSEHILSTQVIDGKLGLADVCIDLGACTLCIPVTDFHSPLEYAIVNGTH